MPETMSHSLTTALRALLDHGYEVTFARDPGGCGYLTDLTGPLGSHAAGTGNSPAGALEAAWPRPGHVRSPAEMYDEDQAEPCCRTCGSPVGIFQGRGDGWHHYTGNGTADSPVELYDAGHAPGVAWRQAGAR